MNNLLKIQILSSKCEILDLSANYLEAETIFCSNDQTLSIKFKTASYRFCLFFDRKI